MADTIVPNQPDAVTPSQPVQDGSGSGSTTTTDNTEFSVGAVQFHTHNGTDSPQVDIRNINRFPSTPIAGDIAVFSGSLNKWVGVSAGTSGYVLTSNGTGTVVAYAANAPSVMQSTFTTNTRQSVTKGSAVAIGNGTNSYVSIVGNLTQDTAAVVGNPRNNWFGQTFVPESDVTSILGVNMWLHRGNVAGTSQGSVSIRATSSGLPTGADLGVTSTPAIGQNTDAQFTITFSPAVNVNAGSTYAIVVRSGTDNSGWSFNYKNSGVSLQGQAVSSTDTGSTWGNLGNAVFYYQLNEQINDKGLLSLANAGGSTAAYYDNFIGFANQTVGTNTACVVNIGGIDTNQSGLTVGTTYLLGNTDGAIQITPGTISRKVGLSVGTSKLLIKQDNV